MGVDGPFGVRLQCGVDAIAGGGVAATAIDLFEKDESALACSDGGLNSAGTGRYVEIQIATAQYAMESMAPLTAPLTPGTYTILDEGENDENLCSGPESTPIAIFGLFQFGLDDAQEIAIAGTVTIDDVKPHSIVGSFDVRLGGPYGQTDGAPPTLTGRFNAVTCP